MNSDESDSNWILGVVLGLFGSFAINTGNNIQALGLKSLNEKKATQVDSDKVEKQTFSPFSSQTWIIGTAIFVSGSLINFASYAFAAQSLLASLQSIQFVSNLILGKCLLKARITNRMLIGTAFTVIGTSIAVQFSSKAVLVLTIDDMVDLYRNPAYITYLVLVLIFSVALHIYYKKSQKKIKEGNQHKYTMILVPLSYSLSSALIGTQSVVNAKILAELLAAQSTGTENVFMSTFTYISILFWFSSAFIWLKRLNYAIGTFSPILIIPLLQCSFIFFSILSGGLYFKEFNGFTKLQWVGFWLGIWTMFCGLALLTPTHDKIGSGEFVVNSTYPSPKSISSMGKYSPRNNVDDQSVSNGVDDFEDARTDATPRRLRMSNDNDEKPEEGFVATLKDTLVETTMTLVTQSAIFFTPPTTALSLTNVMIDVTKEEERQKTIREILQILKEGNQNKDKTFSDKMMVHLKELNLVPDHVHDLVDHFSSVEDLMCLLKSRSLLATTLDLDNEIV